MRALTEDELARDKAVKITLKELEQAAGDFFDLYHHVRELKIEKRRDGFWAVLPDGSEFALSQK
jgi:hypothetical protein